MPPEAWGSPASSGAAIEETPTSAAWGLSTSSGAAIEETSTSATWLWESSASKVVAIIFKAAGLITAGLLSTNGETLTSAAWGSADAKLMPNVALTKADPLGANEETTPSEAWCLSASSGVVDVETSASVASGELVAAGEAGSGARRAKLAPSALSGFGEAHSSADAVLAGDGASGEGSSADAVRGGDGASDEGDVNMAMWTPRARASKLGTGSDTDFDGNKNIQLGIRLRFNVIIAPCSDPTSTLGKSQHQLRQMSLCVKAKQKIFFIIETK